MTSQELKNSILQYAIQGKLVPQNPNDEPASELLKRIKAEKEQLILEKKIKKEKALQPITDDEIPFEIPESWEWLKLGEMGTWGSGATPSRGNSNYYTNGTIPWLKTGDLTDNFITEIPEKITEIALKETSVKVNPVGSVLIAMYGATIGKLGILTIEATTNQACCACQPFAQVYNKYLFYYLQSQKENIKSRSEGGAQPNISKEKILEYPFPLPPLSEQQRIVAKIEELMPLVEEYGKAEAELKNLNKAFPEQIKKSVLQYAIQGKLVSQNPQDEPASMLLAKIKAEKQQLINDKKIKAEKPLPPITEEEIPFEIPSNWIWVKLGDIGTYRKGPFGSSLTKSMFVPKSKDSIKVYEQKNAIYKNQLLGDYYIKKEYFETKMKGFEVFPNDILVSCAGTIGETFIFPEYAERGIINQALMTMKITKEIHVDYFLLYFDYILKQTAKTASNGSAIKNIPPFDVFKNMLFPLPPLSEQKRIVEKVNEVLGYCEKLK